MDDETTLRDLARQLDDLRARVRLWPYLAAVLALLAGLVGSVVGRLEGSGSAGTLNARTLVARKLELRDDAGRVRGELAIGADGSPWLTFYDPDKRPRLWLTTGEDGASSVAFADAKGQMRIHMNAKNKGSPNLRMYDAKGIPRIFLNIGSQSPPAITIYDPETDSYWQQP